MLKKLLILVAAGALLGGLLMAGLYYHNIYGVLKLASPQIIEVHKGDGLQQVVQRVNQQVGQKTDLSQRLWIRLYSHLHPNFHRSIHAGEYKLLPGDSLQDFFQRLKRHELVRYRVTIIEGSSYCAILHQLQALPKLADKSLTCDDISAQLKLPTANPEGWFFPDTYFYTSQTSVIDLLRQGYQQIDQHLQNIWAKRSENLPLVNPYDALILASIIEKETHLVAEMPKVAGVFVRRLQEGMRLQADPTIIYGLGESFNGDLTRANMRQDTPYNTYLHHGLPPTPIGVPSKAALLAAVNPDLSQEYRYFVADGSGGHYFSRSYPEHKQAVQRYLQWLKNQSDD